MGSRHGSICGQKGEGVSRYARGVEKSATSGPASSLTHSRGALVGTALAAAGVLAGGSFFRRTASVLAAGSKSDDTRILNLVLVLEYTEEAFYAEAIRRGALRGELRTYAVTAQRHERDHVRLLRGALGPKAASRPGFDFGRATRDPHAFARTAIRLEDLAVAGYNGQATNLTPATLAVAATIVSVEARHAAWIRAISGKVAAPEAVDKPATAAEVERGLRQIGMRP
jgi:hypothetical protein